MDLMMTRRQALVGMAVTAVGLTATTNAALAGEREKTGMVAEAEDSAVASRWQGEVSFPDWMGAPRGTLPLNCSYSYQGYHGQGALQVSVAAGVEDFSLFVNGHRIDTSKMAGGGTYGVDVSACAVNGTNTLSITNIVPSHIEKAVTVRVDYPVVLAGTPFEEGINPATLEMVSKLIETDIEHGFTSAQLAIVRNGRMVYEGAWGRTNSYLPDGRPDTESPQVTTSTLYDLASNSKMYSVNYAIQLLVSQQRLDLDARIVDFLGTGFATDTILAHDKDGKLPEASLETIKGWKAGLTIRELLRHQGGFPPSPKYPMQTLFNGDITNTVPQQINDLFAGNGADEATKAKTVEMICKTPLDFEPGTKTVYSDVDYMVLGLVVEKVTGTDLDTFLKRTFLAPMGLTHITYNPLKAGFRKDDCAATELNGNSRDHSVSYEGFRTETIQGQAHDEMAYYSMAGVSGHAGLFATATDLAKLAFVMLSGGYGHNRFFDKDVLDAFAAPKSEGAATWGLGWWREGDQGRPWYFGTQSARSTVGHQGWTGTLTMVDAVRNLVVVYLTNRINSPVTDPSVDVDTFDGSWYTAATLGFVPQIISIGMDQDIDVSDQLLDLAADMCVDSLRLIPEGVDVASNHPSVKNFESKRDLFERLAEASADTESVVRFRESIESAYQHARNQRG